MKRVTGIGGVFFKAQDQEKAVPVVREAFWASSTIREAKARRCIGGRRMIRNTGMTAWTLFEKDTKYFNPSQADFMINYRVDDLMLCSTYGAVEGEVKQLRKARRVWAVYNIHHEADTTLFGRRRLEDTPDTRPAVPLHDLGTGTESYPREVLQ